LTHLRPGLRHFSLLRHNPHFSTRLCTTARYKCIDWLINWFTDKFKVNRLRIYKSQLYSKQFAYEIDCRVFDRNCPAPNSSFSLSLSLSHRRLWILDRSQVVITPSSQLKYETHKTAPEIIHVYIFPFFRLMCSQEPSDCNCVISY